MSGQFGIDPDRLEIVDDAMKITIYYTDMDDLRASMNEYEAFVSEPYPVRSTVEVK